MAITASPADQRRLLDLQKLDTERTRFEHRAKNMPQSAEIATLDASLAILDRTVLERLGAKDDLDAEIRRIESDVATVEARIVRDQSRLTSGASAKDAQALEHEIVSLQKRRGDLEDIQLTVMERAEAATEALEAVRAEAATARAQRETLAAARDAELEVLKADLAEVARERETIATTIPEDLLKLYDRQRERYGFGASLLRRRTSEASGVELTAAELAEIARTPAESVILCPGSSAILVRTEESGL
ncbi:zinc ribbon domain-containing protein [Humidisolicoccus flavus]|uniref:zinc ribbon domain-containing protein n=1 Tax=Humidisolicoccus flavus TaxID=3111414 RepID=UPI00324E2CF6